MRHNQNRRSRGRGRKGPNPLTRSYESNGPDVKVRGTAAHVAEKYSTLARDALSSGDPVAAEAYFQHAEHYNRIVAAAQAQAPVQPQSPSSGQPHAQGQQPIQQSVRSMDDDGEPQQSDNAAGGNGSSESVESATSTDDVSASSASDGGENGQVASAAENGAADAQPDLPEADEKPAVRKPSVRRPRRKKADVVTAASENTAPASEVAPDAKSASGTAGGEDKTQDGTAALAAFPD